jgi:hypothetical protein
MTPKRVVKKVVARKIPTTRTPGAPAVRPAVKAAVKKEPDKIFFGAKPVRRRDAASGYKPPTSDSGGSIVGTILLFLVALGLLGAVAVCFVSPDMSAVTGFPFAADKKDSPNLLRQLDDAISEAYTDKKEATLTFTEEELNTYVNLRLRKNQRGPLSSMVQITGVFCDLQPDTATVYLVRKVFGHPLVTFTSYAFEGDPDNQRFKPQMSGIGLVKVQGANLSSISTPFDRLKVACARELGALRDATVDKIRIDDGKIVVHVH